MVDVWILVFSYFNLHTVYASGRTKFECQDGFYLSNVKSVFENEHRFYEFGCSPLSSHQVQLLRTVPLATNGPKSFFSGLRRNV